MQHQYTCKNCGRQFFSWRLRRVFCCRACRNTFYGSATPEQFWRKVDKETTPSGCWPWTGAINRYGYGKVEWKYRSSTSHRVAWELTYGVIPVGLCVCHACDNPICCRPDHLWLGTNADNVADREAKGRGWKSMGELDGMAKLTWKEADYIREQVANGQTQRCLAVKFRVSPATICMIVGNKAWRR